jgi:hypothetical protein
MLQKIINKLSISLIILISFLAVAKSVLAIENPLEVSNNHFGIHILQEIDLEDAAALVNSSGGDWGYVTLVIRKDERDSEKWQRIFDKMRELHLIPIVRIASKQQNSHWEKLLEDEIDGWVNFLNSLNWVIKNRYIVVGNEPNHATEWGNEVDPEEYVDYLVSLSEKLKSESDNFFVLPAGLDASAPSDKKHLSEVEFLRRMTHRRPGWFDAIDGWTSHSYPNPNFSGSDKGRGRGTIRTYQWEIKYLKESLKLDKDLPVFITEAGWAHNKEGKVLGYKAPSKIAQNFKNAFETAWQDESIVAITPFVLDYQDEPFDIFSWKKNDGTFYDFYEEVQKISKIAGHPVQVNTVEIITTILPPIYKVNNNKYGIAYLKNTGQAIWKRKEFLIVQETDTDKPLEIQPISFSKEVKPQGKTLALYRFNP